MNNYEDDEVNGQGVLVQQASNIINGRRRIPLRGEIIQRTRSYEIEKKAIPEAS